MASSPSQKNNTTPPKAHQQATSLGQSGPDKPHHPPRWYKSLRLRYASTLLILFAIGIVIQVKSNQLLSDSLADSKIQILADHQQMLCEQIIRYTIEIGSNYQLQQHDTFSTLSNRSDYFADKLRENHHSILSYLTNTETSSNRNQNRDLQSLLASIGHQIEAYASIAKSIQQNAINENPDALKTNLDSLATLEQTMLPVFEKFAAQFSQYSHQKITQAKSNGNSMFLLTIAIGISMMLFVIEPGIRAQQQLIQTTKNSARMISTQQKAADQAGFVMITDADGTITEVNDKMCQLSGYSREELIGSNPRIFNSGHHSSEFYDEMYETLHSGKIWRGEILDRNKDNTTFWADTTIVPMLDPNGEVCSFYSMRIDITRQKEAEHELQTILDAFPSLVLYKDESNTILRINQSAAQSIGLDPDDIKYHNANEFLKGDDIISSHSDDLDVLASGTPTMGTIETFTSPTGMQSIMRVDKIPMLDTSGYYSRIVTIATDITEIVEIEQRLALVIEATKAGIWDWNVDDNTLHTNDRYFTMVGDQVPQSPIKADFYHSRIHPDDLQKVNHNIENIQMPGSNYYESEFRLLCQDQTYRWIRSTGKVIETNIDGTAKRIIGQHLDVDKSKRLDLAIRTALELKPKDTQSETLTNLCASLAEATQTSFAGISTLSTDDQGRTTATLVAGVHNNQAIQPFQHDISQTPCERSINETFCYIPNNVTDEFPDNDYLKAINACGYAGLKLTNNAGEKIGVLMIVDSKPLNTPFDTQTALQLFGARAAVELEHSNNESRLREAAELAKSLSQSKSDFLANMSHEIRTPMTAILGFADMLKEDNNSAQSSFNRLDAIETIQSNGNHLLTIINDILDISKIEAGKMTVELINVHTLEILSQIESLMADRIQGKGLDFNIVFDTPIPETIQSDPTRLRQILLNLVGNAIKFTEVGSISIHCSMTQTTNPLLQIKVVDTGIGMTKDQCSNIFESFSQADTSTTRKFGGTGLGLNISLSLAQMLGGNVQVESNPNTGSSFCLTINPGNIQNSKLVGKSEYDKPHHSEQSSENHTTALPKNTLKDYTILLVEDGPDNQRLISHHLRKAGAHVDFAENGRIGVDTITAPNAPHYDLILMDMQMPILDGYGAATELRNQGCTIPIIALTAHAMSGAREKCLEAGCNDYQTKPINKINLIKACVDQINNAPKPPQQEAA